MRRSGITVVLAVSAALACADAPVEGLIPVAEGRWVQDESREIPLPREAATPLVVAHDMHGRVWMADHPEHEVVAFDESGDEDSRVTVERRGVVTAMGFDRDRAMMVYIQRRTAGWPIGKIEIYDIGRGRGRKDDLNAQWHAPASWWGEDITERRRQLASVGGPARVFASPVIVRNVATMNRKGVVYAALPLFGAVEKFRRTGRIMATYEFEDLQPFMPAWIISLRGDALVMGDAWGERLVICDQSGRVTATIDYPGAGSAVAAAKPGGGFAVVAADGTRVDEYSAEGTQVRSTGLDAGPVAGALVPDDDTLWLFHAGTWQWVTYTYDE